MQHVKIYTTGTCPYCIRAKQLLAERGVTQLEEIRVDLAPERRTEMAEITGRRTVPQIFIGTTHAPATPYSMAQGLSGQLASGVLVTVEGWNHTAYRRGANQCVTRAVEDYFVKGIVPTDGLMCQ